MTKEESEKMEIPAEGREDSEKTEVTKPAGAMAKVVLTKVPAGNKTYIATRLDEALKGAKPVNRSSDLVPLGREFDLMRKKLRLLITAAKHYHAARVEVEKARMEVGTQRCSSAENGLSFIILNSSFCFTNFKTGHHEVVRTRFKVTSS